MKTAGIICEYNPFHNGHAYHIAETKKRLNADGVICVMSGDVVQRGDSAVFPMEIRAAAAVANGADLVLEIPPRFVLRSAQFYAYNAVSILNSLGVVDFLSFGSECGNVDMLAKASESFDKKKFSEIMKSGGGYAAAVGTDKLLFEPNNILGAEYIRALKVLKSKVIPFTIPRNSVAHNSLVTEENFASAAYIRELIAKDGDFSELVPDYPRSESLKTADELWNLISYRLKLGEKNSFENIMNMSEGLDNRLLKFACCESFEKCVEEASCRRYPKARIRRALFSLLFDFEKFSSPPSYTKVLALNSKGRKILKKAEEKSEIPILRKITKKDFYSIPFLHEEFAVKRILSK